GVSSDTVAELAAAGIDDLTIDQLIKLRTHGVNAEYVTRMMQAGLTGAPSVDQIVKLRTHGVSATWVEELAEAGYGGLSIDELVKLRNHGISA
ncbi:MAG: hypothetical protein GWM88_07410, partial [Pseudomonadales bacterium]|nr:hypothetical protein [Pseudomonadales bacterium]NIX07840.1 hypothetical protein [Pseudomonadales bacterium]